MVKILVAPDKFKGSLNALQVCDAIAEGIEESGIDYFIEKVPLADGGEGTCDLLTNYSNGNAKIVSVNDPLFRPLSATYGLSETKTTAFIEMAKASGLQFVHKTERNPLLTSSYGTGELIRHAILEGVDKIVLGIGGSATNDAGIGMAAALGYAFLDVHGKVLKPIGGNLIYLHAISDKKVLPGLKKVTIQVLCDVDNPLHGTNGAAYIYGPQKGADPKMVSILDAGLKQFQKVGEDFFQMPLNFAGAGAAGGVGAGCRCFLRATLHKGIDFIIQTTDLKNKIETSDIVITGEGKLDNQSLSGKVAIEVARIANQFKKKVLMVCGANDLDQNLTKSLGVDSVISLTGHGESAEHAIENAHRLIKKQVAAYFSSG